MESTLKQMQGGVCESPRRKTAWFVLADWWEDHGRADLADAIREVLGPPRGKIGLRQAARLQPLLFPPGSREVQTGCVGIEFLHFPPCAWGLNIGPPEYNGIWLARSPLTLGQLRELRDISGGPRADDSDIATFQDDEEVRQIVWELERRDLHRRRYELPEPWDLEWGFYFMDPLSSTRHPRAREGLIRAAGLRAHPFLELTANAEVRSASAEPAEDLTTVVLRPKLLEV